jgi:hypothetical protein
MISLPLFACRLPDGTTPLQAAKETDFPAGTMCEDKKKASHFMQHEPDHLGS